MAIWLAGLASPTRNSAPAKTLQPTPAAQQNSHPEKDSTRQSGRIWISIFKCQMLVDEYNDYVYTSTCGCPATCSVLTAIRTSWLWRSLSPSPDLMAQISKGTTSSAGSTEAVDSIIDLMQARQGPRGSCWRDLCERGTYLLQQHLAHDITGAARCHKP